MSMRFDWTDERLEAIRKYHRQGMSLRKIAAQLSRDWKTAITPNMVISQAQRRMPDIATQQKPRTEYAGRQKKPIEEKLRHSAEEKRILQRVSPKVVTIGKGEYHPAPVYKPKPPIGEGKISIMQLTSATCRWPYGESDFMFCGDPVKEGEVYCPCHCEISYNGKRYTRAFVHPSLMGRIRA